MKIKETVLAVLSDTHTGSSTALFPAQGFKGNHVEDNPILPNKRQKMIQGVMATFRGEVAVARKDKRLIIVMLGDAIDGFHHGSMQESLFREQDQIEAHVSIMRDFMERTGFDKQKGDELYYVRGTEAHVKDNEKSIARKLNAKKSQSGIHVHEILELPINGKLFVFAHHGKGRGEGANEGNELRNFLRNNTIDRRKDGVKVFDVLVSGHTHGHTWATWNERMEEGKFRGVHGVICPSWQAKTTYAYGKVALSINSVGGVYINIGVDGKIGDPQFVTRKTTDY